jgi:hypothetical protein
VALDCVSLHRAFLVDRGGSNRWHQIDQMDLVRWNRIRDDISDALIRVGGTSASAQASQLAAIEPGRHELVIYRGTKRVWEGPITRSEYRGASVEIAAKDVMYYVKNTAMRSGYDNSYPRTTTVIDRIVRILTKELARKEKMSPKYNILPHVVAHHSVGEARTSTKTEPYQSGVWDHIDDLAAKSGIDYTVIGRSIHLWDTSDPLGITATVTQADFLGDVVVTVYGSELVTRAIATDGQGGYGIAGPEIDPYYGEWERVDSSYDETEGGPKPTQAELNSQAQRNKAGHNPTPLQVRVPDNSSLNMKGVLTVDDLVPGVFMPLLATQTHRSVSQMQKLESVKFEETKDGETVSVSLFPAPSSATVKI